MGALRQWYLYARIEKRGASKAWCSAGKARAIEQMKSSVAAFVFGMIELIGCLLAALMIAFALWIFTGAR